MGGRIGLLDLFSRWDRLGEPIPLVELRRELGRLALGRADLAECIAFNDRSYQRILLHSGESYEALLLCWRSGQRSAIHDHVGSACAVYVVEGSVTETVFLPSPCGRLVPTRSRTMNAGSVCASQGADIHQMGNLEPTGCDLLTLHVYSPPLVGMRSYSIGETVLADNDALIGSRPPTIAAILGRGRAGDPPASGSAMDFMSPGASPADRAPVVAIVGGGFSGTLVAVNLTRLARGRPLRVLLFERRERFARGVAYGTSCPQHLLNVPAGMMSALPDEPDHFLGWLQARDPSAQRGTFAPRQLYGEYLEDLLSAAAKAPGATIELVRDEVVAIDLVDDEDGPCVALTGLDGRRVRADQAILALGNPTPQDPLPGLDLGRAAKDYRNNPWDEDVLGGLDRDDAILLIGTGLTAVDLIVEARVGGLRGPILVVSRHGLLPFPHKAVPPRPHVLGAPGGNPKVRSLLRQVRQEATRCTTDGGDWRTVVDSLRPAVQGIWRSFDNTEKRRFLRHLSAHWDVHRHRVAPDVARIVEESRRDGQLTIIAGRVLALDERDGRVEVTLMPRGSSEPRTVRVRRVVNCTGPTRDIRIGRTPLLGCLIDGGYCRPDALSMGLEATDAGALIAADGLPSDRLYALGPLLKGRLWETTAVRELRVQALELAKHLMESTHHYCI